MGDYSDDDFEDEEAALPVPAPPARKERQREPAPMPSPSRPMPPPFEPRPPPGQSPAAAMRSPRSPRAPPTIEVKVVSISLFPSLPACSVPLAVSLCCFSSVALSVDADRPARPGEPHHTNATDTGREG